MRRTDKGYDYDDLRRWPRKRGIRHRIARMAIEPSTRRGRRARRESLGLIFLSEGILKFLRPDELGSGRFGKAGIPAPGSFAPLDGVFEIVCGLLILAGLVTRLAAVPMIVNMVGALLITKLPILWGDAPLFEGESGWWDFAHESRTDLAQLCGSLFLLLVGAGAYSLDARLHSTSPSAAAASGAEAVHR